MSTIIFKTKETCLPVCSMIACLIDIGEQAVQLLPLKPGQRICINCEQRYVREKKRDDEADEMNESQDTVNTDNELQRSTDTDSKFSTPRSVSVATLNKSEVIFQYTPVKMSGLQRRDRVVYDRQKVEQLDSVIKVKRAKILDIKVDEIDPSSSQTDNEDDSYSAF